LTAKSSYNGLVMPSVIWLTAIGAALFAAYLKGVGITGLWPVAAIAVAPAVIGLILSPVLRREWAQLLVIFAWLALAIIACISISFIPMAVLFLCAPAAAALFEKEKVVEAMVMAAIFAGLLYYAGQLGHLPETKTTEAQSLWGKQAGLIATIGLMVTTMFGAARSKAPQIHKSIDSLPEHLSVESETLLNAVDGAVIRYDEDNKMVSSNMQARTLFGFAEGLSFMPLKALMPHDAEAQTDIEYILEHARSSGTAQSANIDARFDTDELTNLQAVATPLKDGEVLLHVRDLTALSRTNMADVQATDDKALFFAGVSHELRTPLNAIIGFSDMMRSRLFGPLPGKYAEYADLIHDSGQHMLDLIGDVLDMSKVQAGKYELHYDSFDAADVVRSTVKMIRPTADSAEVRLSVEVDDTDPLIVEADRKAVRQILLNLLSNAIKFSHKGGTVNIMAKSVGDTLNLTVQDHGIGMSAEETLGEPYKQTASSRMIEDRGTGLGLSLVKSLTELHQGRFTVASQPDEGTTVDIFLPQSRA